MWWDFLLESGVELLGVPQAGCDIWKRIAAGTLESLRKET